MGSSVLTGLAAGAIGTVGLNITTYADMALRGRGPSSVPAKLVGTVTDWLGLDLGGDGDDDETAQHRRSGLGALMGYVTGLGVGAVYGLVRPQLDDVPLPLLSVGVGLAAMAASDVPATALGATDPATWSGSDWALDVGFHVVYGVATVLAFNAIADR